MGRIISLGSNPKLARAITVSGSNGTVLANGTQLEQGQDLTSVLEEILVREIFPAYAAPTAGLSCSTAGPLEVGTAVAPVLTPSFSPGDAGPLTAYALSRNGLSLASDQAEPIESPPFTQAPAYVLPLGTSTYTATYDYAQGLLKSGNAGSPAPGRIAAGSVSASQQLGAFYRVFFGAAAAAPADSAAVRALPGSQLTSAGSLGVLLTGTSSNVFAIVLPPGRRLLRVTDLDNQNLNLSAKYVLQPEINVNDAGDSPVAGYTVYLLTTATPYTTTARHEFSYA